MNKFAERQIGKRMPFHVHICVVYPTKTAVNLALFLPLGQQIGGIVAPVAVPNPVFQGPFPCPGQFLFHARRRLHVGQCHLKGVHI